jgi:hypothetical protein
MQPQTYTCDGRKSRNTAFGIDGTQVQFSWPKSLVPASYQIPILFLISAYLTN